MRADRVAEPVPRLSEFVGHSLRMGCDSCLEALDASLRLCARVDLLKSFRRLVNESLTALRLAPETPGFLRREIRRLIYNFATHFATHTG